MATTAIVLFNRDLRLHDQRALTDAAREFERVVPLFVLDDGILGGRFAAPNRVGFLLESLRDLDRALHARGAWLVLRRGDGVAETARVAEAVGATDVFASADVSAYAKDRERRLRGTGLDLHLRDGVTVVPPRELAPAGRDHYRVFTPYWHAWRACDLGEPLPAPRSIRLPRIAVGRLPKLSALVDGARSPDVAPGGETEARRRLTKWLRSGLDRYGQDRGGSDLAADSRPGSAPISISAACRRARRPPARAAGTPPKRGCESSAGATSTRSFSTRTRRSRATIFIRVDVNGAPTTRRSPPGSRAAPACRSSTRGCVSSRVKAGCTTGLGSWPRRSSRTNSESTGVPVRSASTTCCSTATSPTTPETGMGCGHRRRHATGPPLQPDAAGEEARPARRLHPELRPRARRSRAAPGPRAVAPGRARARAARLPAPAGRRARRPAARPRLEAPLY